MNTKKAIEFLRLYKRNHINEPCQEEEGIDSIIGLLQRGEKFEAMLKEFLRIYCWAEVEENVSVKKVFDDLKQKYFPKSKSRWQRINDILEALNTVGVSPDRKELVGLLIELRDEEL